MTTLDSLGFPFVLDVDTLQYVLNFTLSTLGALDLLGEMPESRETHLVLGFERLIQVKRSTGRPREISRQLWNSRRCESRTGTQRGSPVRRRSR